ncbi:Galactosyltransferase N-terminal [Trinorchestia longiramus]|nr:Galactosyltransferase N-terminal [Trinorchestia longiramus]
MDNYKTPELESELAGDDREVPSILMELSHSYHGTVKWLKNTRKDHSNVSDANDTAMWRNTAAVKSRLVLDVGEKPLTTPQEQSDLSRPKQSYTPIKMTTDAPRQEKGNGPKYTFRRRDTPDDIRKEEPPPPTSCSRLPSSPSFGSVGGSGGGPAPSMVAGLRRCFRGACESNKRPWKVLLLILLLLSGMQMYANMTFYNHSSSLFFFNVSNALVWSGDGRLLFKDRWQNALFSTEDASSTVALEDILQLPAVNLSSQSVNVRFNHFHDAKIPDKPTVDTRHLDDESQNHSLLEAPVKDFKNSSFPTGRGHKHLQNVYYSSKNNADDVNPQNEVKSLGGVGTQYKQKHIKQLSSSRPTLRSDGSLEGQRERASHNMTARVPHKSLLSDELPMCPPVPPDLDGPIHVDTLPASLLTEESRHPELLLGGRWRPPHCQSRHKVAVIIPYRARPQHLAMLLRHLHSFLQRQQLDYGIFVVEQAGTGKFNRAMLLNIGALESMKLYTYQCFIFHDIDLLPEDDRNLYSCPQQPRHMSVAIDTMHYQLPYNDIFGGVSALSVEHMRLVNGFSNKFWGWGGEDDDMSNRLKYYGLYISRYPANIARYTMLSHKKEDPNPQRYQTLFSGKKRFRSDGLNSIKYRLLDLQLRKLFTWIYVEPQKS